MAWFAKTDNGNAYKGPSDIVAMDFGTSGLKIVRLRLARDQVVLVGADIMNPLPVELDEQTGQPERVKWPGPLLSNYAALAFSSGKALVRMITLAPNTEQGGNIEQQISSHFSLSDEYRMAHCQVAPSHGKIGAKVLAAAVPEAEAKAVLGYFASGPPAPCSLELAGLSSLTAFELGPGKTLKDEAVCLIETGARCTYIAILNRGIPVLLRKYEIGAEALIQHVAQRLGVEREMALAVLTDGAIDLVGMLHDTMGFVFRQFSISRDFVERQEQCRVRHVYVTGGMSLSTFWRSAVEETLGLDVQTFDPFSQIEVPGGVLPDLLKNQRPRFTSAMGAGLGVLFAS